LAQVSPFSSQNENSSTLGEQKLAGLAMGKSLMRECSQPFENDNCPLWKGHCREHLELRAQGFTSEALVRRQGEVKQTPLGMSFFGDAMKSPVLDCSSQSSIWVTYVFLALWSSLQGNEQFSL
jgi:hypothetical protein